jgi:hypothetical protein
MPEYIVKVVRCGRVTERVYVTLRADSAELAQELADDTLDGLEEAGRVKWEQVDQDFQTYNYTVLEPVPTIKEKV